MKPNILEAFTKGRLIINSCETEEQLSTAEEYCALFIDQYGVENFYAQKLANQFLEKQNEIVPHESNHIGL